jgi:DNA gyrase subunit B
MSKSDAKKKDQDETEAYGAEQITVLKGLQAVQMRPGMYIGSTGARGLHHLAYEVVDNSIDEAMAGYCTAIKVTIHKGDAISVSDNGRGIPTEMHPIEKIPGVEVALTILHAGGKFDKDSYKVSGGLHGVGVSCVNALSSVLKVWVKRGGKEHYMDFIRGATKQKLKVLREVPKKDTGTTVWFQPDTENIFKETGEYSYSASSRSSTRGSPSPSSMSARERRRKRSSTPRADCARWSST